jgi:hypothetical protein
VTGDRFSADSASWCSPAPTFSRTHLPFSLLGFLLWAQPATSSLVVIQAEEWRRIVLVPSSVGPGCPPPPKRPLGPPSSCPPLPCSQALAFRAHILLQFLSTWRMINSLSAFVWTCDVLACRGGPSLMIRTIGQPVCCIGRDLTCCRKGSWVNSVQLIITQTSTRYTWRILVGSLALLFSLLISRACFACLADELAMRLTLECGFSHFWMWAFPFSFWLRNYGDPKPAWTIYFNQDAYETLQPL